MNYPRFLPLLICMALLLIAHGTNIQCADQNGSLTMQTPARLSQLTTEVSAGELIDKITILGIKLERISDKKKLLNIQNELRSLLATAEYIPVTKELNDLTNQLLEINKALWNIEDKLRIKESRQEFDTEFIELARAVYLTNDKRSEVKRAINQLLGSRLIEEKSLPSYKIQAA